MTVPQSYEGKENVRPINTPLKNTFRQQVLQSSPFLSPPKRRSLVAGLDSDVLCPTSPVRNHESPSRHSELISPEKGTPRPHTGLISPRKQLVYAKADVTSNMHNLEFKNAPMYSSPPKRMATRQSPARPPPPPLYNQRVIPNLEERVRFQPIIDPVKRILIVGGDEITPLGLGEDAEHTDRLTRIDHGLPPDENIKMVATHAYHFALLTECHKVYTWGSSDDGKLGREGPEDFPVQVPPSSFPPRTTFVKIVCSDNATFLLTDKGEIFFAGTFRVKHATHMKHAFADCVFKNPSGDKRYTNCQTGDGTTSGFVKISGKTNFKDIAAGDNFLIGVDHKHVLYSLGFETDGILGRERSGLHTRARRNKFEPYPITVVNGRKSVKFQKVFAGHNHAFAVTVDKEVYGWGANGAMQLGFECEEVMEEEPTTVLSREALNLMSDAQRKEYKPIPQETSGQDRPEVRKNYVGHPTRVNIPGDEKINMIAGGLYHTIFLSEEGNLFATGRNQNGQLGLPKENGEYSTIKPIESYTTFRTIGAGGDHSLAICCGHRCWAWGWNEHDRIGCVNMKDADEPTEMRSSLRTAPEEPEMDVHWKAESIHGATAATVVLATVPRSWIEQTRANTPVGTP